MNEADAPHALWPALLFSLLMHVGLIFGLPGQGLPPAPPPQSSIIARLVSPPPAPEWWKVLPNTPELELPPDVDPHLDNTPDTAPPKQPASSTPPKPPRPDSPAPEKTPLERLVSSARRQLDKLIRQEGFYPLEAVENGWEGEAWVQIFLDERGNVIAARIEEKSAHPILDEAALRAARALKGLPANGLESVVLPVRFRLAR
jgi:protein TonB